MKLPSRQQLRWAAMHDHEHLPYVGYRIKPSKSDNPAYRKN